MGWRQEARRVIREYPELVRRARALHEAGMTPSYSGMPGGGAATRTTELVAMRQLSPPDQRKLDAVQKAIGTTARYSNGDLRLRVIDLLYWRRTHTMEGAACSVHVSVRTAQAWHGAFVELVDAYLRVL